MIPLTFPSCERLLLLSVILTAAVTHAAPFIPASDDVVLERVERSSSVPTAKDLRELRAKLAAHPQNVNLAVDLARRCVERSRAEGDPRYLGQAQAALKPWWSLSTPPLEALVLRAVVKQASHRFEEALVDLDTATKIDPHACQAWLTRATVLSVLGRYDEARRSCLHLSGRASELVSLSATASVASLTGQADAACRALRATLERAGAAPASEQLWARTILAETTARLGRTTEAEAEFRTALSIAPGDPYLLGAYSDFLLDQGRPREVIPLLKEKTRIDPLLLRLALAEARVRPASGDFFEHVTALQARLEANRRRGNRVHQREEARFILDLLHRPAEALPIALANWQVQKEPADLRLVLETAWAAKQPSAAAPCLEFIRTNHLEDVQIEQLVSRLTAATALVRSP